MQRPPVATLASDVHRTVLPSGLTVLVKEVYPAQVVSVGLWVRVGSADEHDEVAGVSHFLEHMLFKGTPTRPVGSISQQVHGLGGYMNAFTSYDCTCYWMVVPNRHLDTALDIQCDALLNSLFDPGEVQREALVILEELRMYEDRPASLCHEKLMGLMFPGNPYGRPIIGFRHNVSAMGRNTLADWYRQHYQPSNITMVLVGDVRTEAALARLTATLGTLPPQAVPHRQWPGLPALQSGRQDMVGPIHGAHLHVGYRVPAILSPEAAACDLLANLLGGGRSSRLYQSLREQQGLVTSVGSSVTSERDASVLSVEAVTVPGRPDEVLAAIRQQIDGLQQQPVPATELQKAKNMVEAAYVFSQETVEGQGRKLGYGEMLGDCALAERYLEKLYQVTADDVLQRARTYLSPTACCVVSYQPA